MLGDFGANSVANETRCARRSGTGDIHHFRPYAVASVPEAETPTRQQCDVALKPCAKSRINSMPKTCKHSRPPIERVALPARRRREPAAGSRVGRIRRGLSCRGQAALQANSGVTLTTGRLFWADRWRRLAPAHCGVSIPTTRSSVPTQHQNSPSLARGCPFTVSGRRDRNGYAERRGPGSARMEACVRRHRPRARSSSSNA